MCSINTGDCLIEMTAWAGLTVLIYLNKGDTNALHYNILIQV